MPNSPPKLDKFPYPSYGALVELAPLGGADGDLDDCPLGHVGHDELGDVDGALAAAADLDDGRVVAAEVGVRADHVDLVEATLETLVLQLDL